MAKPKEILKLALDMSRKYYGKPLAVVHSGDEESDKLVSFVVNNLRPEDYELFNANSNVAKIVDGAVFQRLSLVAHGSAFAVKGAVQDECYSYLHASEVNKEDVNPALWDCLLVRAMDANMNTICNPFAEEQ